ncbi:HAD-IIIA family hydrolase [Saccharopolyspora sp. 6M]|uniref:HAD-IIIA family hydrolase n=1 Tax=Saccharopolyspora sp. 6M TaxID=2877237 RepID=UPI001CD61CBD|nr:HAD-IIIA family hydrolase [Saccharopolyspora sp. 6M]MCA1225839.1 HAD-IIIA family hydrolase [Saccharopolyspora sp. 6M]
MSEAVYSVVVPTVGRPSLRTLLHALEAADGVPPREIVVVDDRANPAPPLAQGVGVTTLRVVRTGGRGPAGARNAGWRATGTEWVVFLDDDVVPDEDWKRRLQHDLAALPPEVAASQARIEVPLPRDRRPTDWERNVAGLAGAWWITADMAYRRDALVRSGGFDEDFPRAYREDADLALRVRATGRRLVAGSRTTRHPVPPAGFTASVRAQRGNADDVLMRRKHGRGWRTRIGEGPGRLPAHLLTTGAAVLALLTAKHPLPSRTAAAVWALATAEFALRRILPGPRTAAEITRMVVTSALIPPVAVRHRARGELARSRPRRSTPAAVLFDRDDTLIRDVPYNGEPALVEPVAGAEAALRRLRERGLRIGVISNQSGIARGLLDEAQVAAVNDAVERRLGPFGTWQVCPHDDAARCTCRKPEPGMVEEAAAAIDVAPADCVVVGDTGADVEAALAAGARAILVPTARTLPAEIRSAHRRAEVAATLGEAVDRVLGAAR